jgi:hypothetical protein
MAKDTDKKTEKKDAKKRKSAYEPENEGRFGRALLSGIGGASAGGLAGGALGMAGGVGLDALLTALQARMGGGKPALMRAPTVDPMRQLRFAATGGNLGLGLGTLAGGLGGAVVSNRADDIPEEISSNVAQGALMPLGGGAAAGALSAALLGTLGPLPRRVSPESVFYGAATNPKLQRLMALSGGISGLGAGALKALAPDEDEMPKEAQLFKTAALAGVVAARQKTAAFNGAEEPEYLHREAIPYDTRKQHLQEYLNAKALEAKEPMGKNVGKGVLYGGLMGAIPGALLGLSAANNAGRLRAPGAGSAAALGALLGGAGGAGLGALLQYARVSGDHDAVDEARRLHQDPSAVDRALVQRVAEAIQAREDAEDDYRNEMLAHARRGSYRDESDRRGRYY